MDMKMVALAGFFLVSLVVAVVLFLSISGSNPFKDDCVASGGKYTELSGSEYCTLDGEVYPR